MYVYMCDIYVCVRACVCVSVWIYVCMFYLKQCVCEFLPTRF